MIKRYCLKRGVHFTSERRPRMWVKVNGDGEVLYEKRGVKGWQFISCHGKGAFNAPPVTDACLDKLWADGEAVLVVGPDVYDFKREREAQGVPLTTAVKELARICGVSERSVWRWMDGSPEPPYAKKLMMIWADCTPEQRAAWFH